MYVIPFSKDEELIYVEGKTYLLFKIWRRRETLDAVKKLKEMFPDLNIEYERSEQDDA